MMQDTDIRISRTGSAAGQHSGVEAVRPAGSVKIARCINAGYLPVLVLCLLLAFMNGCAPVLKMQDAGAGEKILAVVDGEPITEEDLKYSLQIAHRREDLSSAGRLSLSEYVQKLIDDMLIIEEARRMGMEQDPQVQKAVKAYVLRESVMKLYNDEVSGKVSISDEEIRNYYKRNYERFSLRIIEARSREEAEKIVEQLKKGADFRDLAERYSTSRSGRDGGKVVLSRRSMPPDIAETIAALRPGQSSDVLKIRDKYYIVKLISRKEAPDEGLKDVRRAVEKVLRKQKEKERADEYLKYLRERSVVKVDKELLSSISLDKVDEWSKDRRMLAEVDGSVLTAAEFAAMAGPFRGKSKEFILNSWIDRKVVDHEALSRGYGSHPDLKKKTGRYENQLLKQAFINKVIIPEIKISDKTLKDYYMKHREEFSGPDRFRVQQITVRTMDEARGVLSSLHDGADFSWLAKKKSIDPAGRDGGELGWLTREELPGPARAVVGALKAGEVSPVFKVGSSYRIIRLQGKVRGEVRRFEEVRDAVYKACFKEEFNTLWNEFVSRLRAEARIKINDEAVKSLEKGLQK